MNKDIIYKEDAIKAIFSKPACHGSDGSWYHSDDIRDAINSTPSADRPQGEWITEEKDSIYGKKIRLKCSECGDTFDVSEKAFPYERFCRYCGADMRKGADDED